MYYRIRATGPLERHIPAELRTIERDQPATVGLKLMLADRAFRLTDHGFSASVIVDQVVPSGRAGVETLIVRPNDDFPEIIVNGKALA
jgi:hypothetical protein